MNQKRVLCLFVALVAILCTFSGCKGKVNPDSEIESAIKDSGIVSTDDKTSVDVVEDTEVKEQTGATVAVLDTNGKKDVVVIEDGKVTVVVPGNSGNTGSTASKPGNTAKPDPSAVDVNGDGQSDVIILSPVEGKTTKRMYIYLDTNRTAESNLVIKEGALTFEKAGEKLTDVYLTTDTLAKKKIGQFELIFEMGMDYANFVKAADLPAEYAAVIED